jgi:hypothetical protein
MISTPNVRKKFELSNVSTMGNIASHTVSNGKDSSIDKKSRPYSTYQAFHIMIAKEQFDIDFVPTTYKQAMQKVKIQYLGRLL